MVGENNGPSHSMPSSNVAAPVPNPAANMTQSYADYYSSPEYQQYYQQYYANAYAAQQQYAAYYQPTAAATAALPSNASTAAASAATTHIYNSMLYHGSASNTPSYLSEVYQQTLAKSQHLQTQHLQNAPQNNAIITGEDEYYGEGNPDADYENGEDDEDEEDDPTIAKEHPNKQSKNTLPYHCNSKMGLNPLIYTNIQQSPYFKNNLYLLKTYHEVIDEIYYSVKHLEPWEKGSRKVSGQTGMCGSVRGVGAGGIISTPFCLLFKLYTLRLTRKQAVGLIRHKDSPFIRGLGFMFIRFTQPPQDLWQWFEPYLGDEEEIDPKAGGGVPMTIGDMVRHFLTKLDWFSTLFPRIPIPIQKDIEEKLLEYDASNGNSTNNNNSGGSSSAANKRIHNGSSGSGGSHDSSDSGYYNNNHNPSKSNRNSGYKNHETTTSSSSRYSSKRRSTSSRSRSRSRSPSAHHRHRSHHHQDKRYHESGDSKNSHSNKHNRSNRYHH